MRTEYCGQLRLSHVGQQVTLCGWVNRRRDLGSLIFIDMRDREGIVQVFFDPDRADALKLASELRNEFCIQVTGTVRARDEKNINRDMATGEIEVLASSLTIINRADVLPLDSNHVNTEEARLKYRYLDLRRPEMAQRLKTRAKITSLVRRFMDDHGFLDIETPMLTKATPEGARDYLVPSRVHKGKFYALPQSPQLFKQLLMMSGFDRYYQIVKCFRDEDLRADRQPEFTQIDVETSFMTAPQVREVMEALVRHLWLEVKGVDLGDFPVMTFAEAERRCDEVKDFYDDLNVKLVRPAGDMLGLHSEFLPASKRYINDYVQYVKSDFLAGLGFGATQQLGETTGIYMGYSVDTGRNVYLQPSLASQGVKGTVTNALASAFVGSLGGGKSFCNNLLVYYSVLFGGQAVILDPKSGAKRSYLKRVGTALH